MNNPYTPYPLASRSSKPGDTIIQVGSALIGGNNLTLIAGPCSIESQAQISSIAQSVKASGASILRGGAFKPRTSPYTFQGLGDEGLQMLLQAKKETGLPVVTELMNLRHLDLFDEVDIIQVGARNMQNFEMLRALGQIQKPILLKRGHASTLEELLLSAEYILSGGNSQVILCERGIRTFEPSTRNTLDISAVPLLKELTHLPVLVDPSHATGIARIVKPLSLASISAGAHGVMVEVHNDPPKALCDGEQSITPAEFDRLSKEARQIFGLLQSFSAL